MTRDPQSTPNPAAPVAATDVMERLRDGCPRHPGCGQATLDEAAAEITHLRAEVADLRSSVVAFGGPWAVAYAEQHGAPKGALHHRHYDILAAAGARMIDFTRWVPDDER